MRSEKDSIASQKFIDGLVILTGWFMGAILILSSDVPVFSDYPVVSLFATLLAAVGMATLVFTRKPEKSGRQKSSRGAHYSYRLLDASGTFNDLTNDEIVSLFRTALTEYTTCESLEIFITRELTEVPVITISIGSNEVTTHLETIQFRQAIRNAVLCVQRTEHTEKWLPLKPRIHVA
jgi:hypothetical protein